MPGIELSNVQVDKARHALGLTRKRIAYRNFYASAEDADWEDLVAKGLAWRELATFGPDFVYRLTRAGAERMLDIGEIIGSDVRFARPAP